MDPTTIPAHMTDEDFAYHSRLVRQIELSQQGVDRAHAGVHRAEVELAAAHNNMNVWVSHLGEKYGLKPHDAILSDGRIVLQDPGWAVEFQRAAVAQVEAAATPDESGDEATAEPEPSMPTPPDITPEGVL